MSTPNKRARESKKALKKRAKAMRRRERREQGPGDIEVTTAEEIMGPMRSAEEVIAELMGEAPMAREASAIPCKLFVGSLSWNTDEAALVEAFEPFGAIEDAVVISDRDTGRSRGFGFVTYVDRKDAARAVRELDGSDLDGRRIVVNVATERR